MQKIKLATEQQQAAIKLNEGKVIFSYKDGNTIRMETENGEDPYVWRNGEWRRMRCS